MTSYDEKIRELEEELKKTPYNKRTQHHVGLVKAKIANIKKRQEVRASSKKISQGYSVKKSGDATAVLVGFPSVGKSTLLNRLTNAESKTANYDFTTLTCIPGLMEYKSAKIQILDIPGIIQGASSGAGRGREVISVARTADLVLAMADAQKLWQIEVIKRELYDANIRLDEKKPNVRIRQTAKGGIEINSVADIEHETIKGILREFRINNGEITIRENITVEQLIDVIEGNRYYIKCLIVLNKCDLVADGEKIARGVNAIPISAENNENIDSLKEEIFKKLDFIRIYMKHIGKKADMDEPMITKKNSTVKNVCEKIHRDFVNKFKFARIWGKSAAFPGQKIGIEHKLNDEDILQIHLR